MCVPDVTSAMSTDVVDAVCARTPNGLYPTTPTTVRGQLAGLLMTSPCPSSGSSSTDSTTHTRDNARHFVITEGHEDNLDDNLLLDIINKTSVTFRPTSRQVGVVSPGGGAGCHRAERSESIVTDLSKVRHKPAPHTSTMPSVLLS